MTGADMCRSTSPRRWLATAWANLLLPALFVGTLSREREGKTWQNDIRAYARQIPISSQKVRLVLDLVRGKDVLDALNILKFETNKASYPYRK